jgi:cytochrome P450
MGNIINISLAVLFISSFYLIWQRQKPRTTTLSQSNNCVPPPKYPLLDPIFGLDLFFKNARAISANQYLPTLQARYAKMGRTFSTLSFGTKVICSIEPENLKTAWVTNFEDWGVQSSRLPALGPFVGRGFLSTDGAEWEHSRALLKPSLRRAIIADLEPFESSLREMIGKIPRDGSTVDLQRLFFDLVTPSKPRHNHY